MYSVLTFRMLAKVTHVKVTLHVKPDLGLMDTDAFVLRVTLGKLVN